jgi:hypothetical protein
MVVILGPRACRRLERTLGEVRRILEGADADAAETLLYSPVFEVPDEFYEEYCGPGACPDTAPCEPLSMLHRGTQLIKHLVSTFTVLVVREAYQHIAAGQYPMSS